MSREGRSGRRARSASRLRRDLHGRHRWRYSRRPGTTARTSTSRRSWATSSSVPSSVSFARFLVPGDDPMGIVGTIVLGIVGAVIGGWAAGAIFEDTTGVDWIAVDRRRRAAGARMERGRGQPRPQLAIDRCVARTGRTPRPVRCVRSSLRAVTSSSELCFLPATELARRIRVREPLGPRGARRPSRPHRGREPGGERHRDAGRRARGRGRRPADEALAGGAEPGPLHGLPIAHKDLVATAGMRTTSGSPIFADTVPDADDLLVVAGSRRRRRAARQDEHAGVRGGFPHVQSGVRRDQEPLRPREDVRRLLGRGRRRARLRHGADRRRQRPRRVAAQPRELLQRGRFPTLTRAGAFMADHERVAGSVGRRAHGPNGRGRRPVAVGPRRAGCPGADLLGRAGLDVRAAARCRSRRAGRGVGAGRGRHDADRPPHRAGGRRDARGVRVARMPHRGSLPRPRRRARGVPHVASPHVCGRPGRTARDPPARDEGHGRVEHRAGAGAPFDRHRTCRTPAHRAGRACGGLLRALRLPRDAGDPGAAVRSRGRVPDRGRGRGDGHLPRLDAVVLVHHGHRLAGDLGAVRVHRAGAADRGADRRPTRRRSRRAASRPCVRAGDPSSGSGARPQPDRGSTPTAAACASMPS